MYQSFVSRCLILSAVLLLGACTSIAGQHADVIRKSATDHRLYDGFTLDNGLKVVVISDPSTHQAAASMDVLVGSGSDPIERQGLAHFLEHMLFLGTEKYPEAGEYQRFIATHGGNNNAYTSNKNTNYFFDIDEEKLEPALDRFAQFFIAPKFDQLYLDREKNAVHSEYHLGLKDDGRRSLDVIKSVVNPAHPFSKFSTGNLITLSERGEKKLRDEVVDFYQKYYSAQRMALVVLGKESIPELKKMVVEKFSIVPAKPLQVLSDDEVDAQIVKEPLFVEGALPSKLLIKSVKNIDSMSLVFNVPDDSQHYMTNPYYFLSHLLGYEGKGSLLAELKRLGWAETLRSGGGISFNNDSLYTIDISLTKVGLKHVDDIVSLFFQTVREIEKAGINESLYIEQKKISRVWFEFKEPQRPLHYVGQVASNLQRYPFSDVLSASHMMETYNPSLIKEMLSYINPNNLLVSVLSNTVESSLKSSWYQTPYSIESVSANTKKQWMSAPISPNIFMPKQNPFLVDNLALVSRAKEQQQPEVFSETKNLKVWHLDANLSKLPKANVYVRFASDYASASIDNVLLNSLYVDVINDEINETTYDAYLTGLNLFFDNDVAGIDLTLTGFNAKQSVLFEQVKQQIKQLKFSEKRFLILKAELKKRLENQRLNKPYSRTYAVLHEALRKPYYSLDALLDTLDSLTVNDLMAFDKAFWSQTKAEVFANGNISKQQISDIATSISELLPASAVTQSNNGWLKVPKGEPLRFYAQSTQNDSAYLRYIQADNKSLEEQAYFLITSQMLKALFYYQLRTEQQLGYLVNAGYADDFGVPGLVFVVQSNHAPTAILDKAVSFFIDSAYENYISKITPEEYENNLRTVRALVITPPKTLREQSELYWHMIIMNKSFDAPDKLLDVVNSISFSDWKAFYKQRFSAKAPKREVRIRTTREPVTKQQLDHLDTWKKSQDTYWVK